LKRAGLSKEVVLGFLDESSHYPNANTARLWSFGTLRLRKNTAKKERVNSFGFYALNGASVYAAKDSSKKDAVIEFLEEVRKRNAGKRIVMILDNFRAHTSWKTRQAAEALGIELVFLPPYSPDLNPIEFIWKSIKRELSAIVLTWKEEVTCVVEALFCEFAASLSFAKRWIEKFLVPLEIKP
jgi:putative transposase